jgi:hypothetical protein
MVTTVAPPGRVARRVPIEIEEQRDFTGGLNLKDDLYNLADNESADLQNVDIDRRGGFGVRRGVRPWVDRETARIVTATGASRTTNVVTATGLEPLNGDANGGLVVGQQYTVNFQDGTYDGTFTIVSAAAGASTATWAQVAADDAAAGPGTLIESNTFPDSGYTYVDDSAVRHLLVARNGQVRRFNGTQWIDVTRIFGGSGRTEFEEFRNVLYILPPGVTVPYTWTGSGLATQLTTAVGNYNDDLTAPNNGNFPQCRTMTTHKEVMWAGGVIEAVGPSHNSRVRWSHPGNGQDWRTNDFIDLDPDDENGLIRALIPFGDRLLVFKDKAVYAIHGDPPANFTVENLTKKVGCPTRWAVVATEQEVYFWDKDTGAWRYDGRNFEWIFEPIFRLIDDGLLNAQFTFQTIVEFHRERLWVSVPSASAGPYGGQFLSLIFQPDSGKKGSWTVHTKTAFGWWVHPGSDGGDLHLLGGLNGGAGANYLYEFDVEGYFQDDQAFSPVGLICGGDDANPEAAQTPDAASLDITTDLEVEFDGYRTDWLTCAQDAECLVSKWQATATGQSWFIWLNDGGFLEAATSTTGANTIFWGPLTTPLPITEGRVQLKFEFDVNNGAGGRTLTVYYKRATDSTYTLLEARVDSGTTTIFNGTGPLVVGAATEAGGTLGGFFGGFDGWNGVVFGVTVRNGIGGTIIANPQFEEQVALTPQFFDSAGLGWTMSNGAFLGFHRETAPIISWYTTRWFDANNSAMKKRWKRPVVVMRAGADQTTVVKVFRDYDPTKVFKQFEFVTQADAETGVWDDPETEWDDEQWAAEQSLGGEKAIALRGAPLSGGVARALKFENNTKGQDWRVHGLIMKWIPRRIRN